MKNPAAADGQRNIRILTVAQALGGAGPPIIISLGGIVGQTLSPDPALATIPVSIYNLGVAVGTLPAAWLMRKVGRRHGYVFGAMIGILGGLVAAGAIAAETFVLFCIGTALAGLYGAYIQSFRFAATDSVSGDMKARAISRVMIGGLFAAIIGPQVVIWTSDAIPGIPYAASFVGQSVLAMATLLLVSRLHFPRSHPDQKTNLTGGRTIGEIARSPRFILAAGTGVVSYGLMSFIMTATPLAMVACGHSVGQATLGIQWHVLAMFGPSFVTGRLIARFGKEKIAATGLILIALCSVTALSGLGLTHFWLALILLGVGWNFGFIGATAMITDCHTPEERGKVQGLNDFLVFGSVALASFLAGALVNTDNGWALMNWLVFPAVLIPLTFLVFSFKRQAA
ncbi:MFS transporter [Martelella mediterranea]|uniref:Putative MFS family arabinose efflux permease n=1 Tax=Martelella mediterranea TaxID=293089 RepID=A0A4R3NWV7_9HYPH|nr:MFS transporter [Martelella mediterranea]TCT45089.1 putative MFS family arabinose efflux permease [Martelella mediterranea]